MQLLQTLCANHAPSGNEGPMKSFFVDYIQKEQGIERSKPQIIVWYFIQGASFSNLEHLRPPYLLTWIPLGLRLGMVELIKIGGPKTYDGIQLVGEDSKGKIETEIYNYEDKNETHIEYILIEN